MGSPKFAYHGRISLSGMWGVFQHVGESKGLKTYAIVSTWGTEEDAKREATKLDNRLKRIEAKQEERRVSRAIP